MEFRQFLKIIVRNKYIIISMCVSAIVTAILLTYVISERYVSTTNVLIRPQRTIDVVPKREEILDFPVSYYNPVETASKTYTEIIKSRNIAERVVKQLGFGAFVEEEGSGLSFYWKKAKNMVKELIVKSWILLRYGRLEEEDAYSSAVTEVQNSLSVKPTKETYLFELQAEAGSPLLASAIANAAAEAFVDYLKELNSHENMDSIKLSNDRIELSRQKLDNARHAIVEFKEKHGIISIEKEKELELESLSELENSIEKINTEITGAEAKKKDIKRQIAELERFSKSATKVTDNPLVRELYSELAKNEVKLAGLRKRYTPEHREVQALLAEIDEIRERLKKESPTLHSEDTLSVDPVYQELLSGLARVDTVLESLKAERDGLALAIQEKKNKIDQIPEREAELAKLELEESMNEETHKLLTREYKELEISASKNSLDVTVISNAPVPLYPVRPIKVYHAGLAGILSLIVGIGIALLMENMNVTVRSIDEAEKRLSLPVLMTIPRLDLVQSNSLPLIHTNGKVLLQEKRGYDRAFVHYPVEIVRQQDAVSGNGVVSDISQGGICCYVEEEIGLQPDDKVEISIDVDKSSEKLRVEGIVLRSKKTIAGYHFNTTAIQFVNINDSLSRKIINIIRSVKSDSPYSLPPHFEEPIRGLRSDIVFMSSQGMSSFLITSCGAQEGKSTVVSNLAMSLAEINKKVIIIDANLRSPSLHRILSLSNETGLSSVLAAGEHPYIKKTRSGVSVLTSGPPHSDPSALLSSHTMLQLFNSLKDEFDFVLFDSPPLLSGPDSALLASMVHGTIVVLNAGKTTVDDFGRAKQILDRSHAKTLGIVMNNFEDEVTSYYTWS